MQIVSWMQCMRVVGAMRIAAPGHPVEELAGKMIGDTLSARRKRQLVRVGLGVLHQLLERCDGSEGLTTRIKGMVAVRTMGAKAVVATNGTAGIVVVAINCTQAACPQ